MTSHFYEGKRNCAKQTHLVDSSLKGSLVYKAFFLYLCHDSLYIYIIIIKRNSHINKAIFSYYATLKLLAIRLMMKSYMVHVIIVLSYIIHFWYDDANSIVIRIFIYIKKKPSKYVDFYHHTSSSSNMRVPSTC